MYWISSTTCALRPALLHLDRQYDLGAAEDEKLRRYYPDRAAWLLEPDARPIALSRYNPEPAIKTPPAPEDNNPILKFEPIPEAR